jgi:hypothetical protein
MRKSRIPGSREIRIRIYVVLFPQALRETVIFEM